jgi:hypothetical protein
MKKTYELKVCKDDFKSGRQAIETVFDIIEKAKAAIFAVGSKLIGFSYSDTPSIDNPCADIATLSFEVASRDDGPRELLIEVTEVRSPFGERSLVTAVIFARVPRSASTKESPSSRVVARAESQAEREQSS